MAFDDDIVLYRQVPIFAALGDDTLKLLAFNADRGALDEGELLFRAGDDADGAFLVLSGALTLSDMPGLPPYRAGPGTLVGETALLSDGERPCRAAAKERTEYALIRRREFLRALTAFPDAAERLQRYFHERISETNRDLQRLTAFFSE